MAGLSRSGCQLSTSWLASVIGQRLCPRQAASDPTNDPCLRRRVDVLEHARYGTMDLHTAAVVSEDCRAAAAAAAERIKRLAAHS